MIHSYRLFRRDLVSEFMHQVRPTDFDVRARRSLPLPRSTLNFLGPNHQWSADGHDKLTQIGFPIYAFRDAWSGYVLGARIMPSNRKMIHVLDFYLDLVQQYGGCPLTVTTDHGSEVNEMYSAQTALRYTGLELSCHS